MTHRAPSPSAPFVRRRTAFTLIELLVVVGIIGVLVAILVPTVSKIRIAAQTASSKNFIVQLTSAIERYQQEQHAYPGPLAYNQIYTSGAAPVYTPDFTAFSVVGSPGFDTGTAASDQKFTMSENLVLGLLGGLVRNGTVLNYNPSFVGNGPVSLNALSPKKYTAYMDQQNLSWRNTPGGKTGHYADDSGAADDTLVPEFVDSYSDPMPIIYLRARKGVSSVGTADNDNPVITNNTNGRLGQYDLSQLIPYTGTFGGQTIGTGKTIKKAAYKPTITAPPFPHGLSTVSVAASMLPQNAAYAYPYDAYPYFNSPSQAGTARQKDAYILISAGPDRVYGTSDDITNFGEIGGQ